MTHRALYPYRMDTLNEAESVLSLRSHQINFWYFRNQWQLLGITIDICGNSDRTIFNIVFNTSRSY